MFEAGQYKIIEFYGLTANFVFPPINLTKAFPFELVENKYILFKSIKFYPYFSGLSSDFSVREIQSDASNALVNQKFTIVSTDNKPRLVGKDLITEGWNFGLEPRIFLNGNNIGFFNFNAADTIKLPIDYQADNIFAYYSERIKEFDIQLFGVIHFNQLTSSQELLNYKVIIECYLFSDLKKLQDHRFRML